MINIFRESNKLQCHPVMQPSQADGPQPADYRAVLHVPCCHVLQLVQLPKLPKGWSLTHKRLLLGIMHQPQPPGNLCPGKVHGLAFTPANPLGSRPTGEKTSNPQSPPRAPTRLSSTCKTQFLPMLPPATTRRSPRHQLMPMHHKHPRHSPRTQPSTAQCLRPMRVTIKTNGYKMVTGTVHKLLPMKQVIV